MPTLAHIKEQIKNIIGDKYLKRPEVVKLQEELSEDEIIIGIIKGTYSGSEGLLIATNKKLRFCYEHGVFGVFKKEVSVKGFPSDLVQSVKFELGWTRKITILTSNKDQAVITVSDKNELSIFQTQYNLMEHLRKYNKLA